MQSTSRREWFKQSPMVAGAVLLPQEDFTKLPSNLPVPVDDGAAIIFWVWRPGRFSFPVPR